MSEKDDGGPAFPYSALTPEGPEMYSDSTGMSLRDWFAGQALAGMLLSSFPPSIPTHDAAKKRAQWAYVHADAMITERRKP